MKIDTNHIAYHGREFKKLENCSINIATHAFQYATMIFAGIRGYYNASDNNLYIFRLDAHLKRLLSSIRILNMQVPEDLHSFKELMIDLSRMNDFRCNVYFRPMVYQSDLELAPRLHGLKSSFSIYSIPLEDYLDTNNGLRLSISSWRRISENSIPARAKCSAGYINSALAKSEALQNGFDEAIFLDEQGYVCEGSAENIFIVKDAKLITPSLSSNVLEGITRNSIIEIAKDLGIEVIERNIGRTELYIADELFLCGTATQIAWASTIDRRNIGDGKIGPISKQLKEYFEKIVLSEVPKFQSWLTPVYTL